MRQFQSVNLIHLLLQTKAKPALGDSKPDRLQRLNRHTALLYDQALREAQHYSPAISGKLSDIQMAAIATRVTAELERVNLANTQQFNAVFRAIEDWQPDQRPSRSQGITPRFATSATKTRIANHLPGL